MIRPDIPQSQGLYDARNEHDACGVGFVVNVKGRKSRRVVEQALEVLLNLEHRGACGCEENTGDGAGILLQTPHDFFTYECGQLGIILPGHGQYGAGMVFLPQDPTDRFECEREFEHIIHDEGQTLLGWRGVPVNSESIGLTAKASQPVIRQIFIQRSEDIQDQAAFERKLYVIRRRVTRAVKRSDIHQRSMFYVASLSYKTIVYKGMLTAGQLPCFYPDLTNPRVSSAVAVIHSRFSTNTFPSWARAHPYRYLAHNGEINTLRGNVNWMRARESKFESKLFGSDLQKILPLIDTEASDSGMFDNVLEMLTLAGRTLPHVMMLMIPAPWSGDAFMDERLRAFYEFHSFLMEPWDGPAAVTFTDGIRVGAVLDRNGLRPARYYVTKDDLVVMASEVGVLDLPADRIVSKGRLQPGKMFLVDTEQGRIIDDEELKSCLANEHPYQQWIDDNSVRLEQLPDPPYVNQSNPAQLRLRQKAFGYTREELRMVISPMAAEGSEPVGSMGTDTPLAVLSERPQLLYNYFKQLFAQVTNPPIDGIREELIMSSDTSVGPEANMLEPTPECARQIKVPSPILTNAELEKLRLLGESSGPWGASGFKSITIPILYQAALGGRELQSALEDIFKQADAVIAAGYETIILSDRDVDSQMAPIPALLAVSGLHHHLIRKGTRTQVGLIVESGEPREVHHFALLLSYGAAAINPYLVFETITHGGGTEKGISNYVKAINKGIIKVISKMGISTTQGYCGAQVFEALGLNQEFIDYYFTWTQSRIGGVGIDVIAEEARLRHERAFDERMTNHQLEVGSEYQYRANGEVHLFNPETIHQLQYACRTGDYEKFKRYSSLVNDATRNLCTLRGLLEFKSDTTPIPNEEVEPLEEILKRFKTGAMSYGSISQESHEALAIAMNRIGGKSNTGEGGEDPRRFYPDSNGDSRNSKIKQVASARFGVTSSYLVHAEEIQIKISQGAKPGEGGQLPGHKVYPWIAQVRHSTPGVGLISPPPHHDIYSIEDLAQLIFDLKNANPDARISVKLVSEAGVGTIAAGVAKARADLILISGYDGGTGASPLTSIKHAGVPWELGLAETHQTLLLNDLRSRVKLESDGQLRTGRDVVIAAMLGAEEFGFATAPLVAMGCIMMRACHLNTCPVGIATQDPTLRERFTGDPSQVVNFMRFIAEEVRELMAELGCRQFNELIGRSDFLRIADVDHWKARGLDFSQILFRPELPESVGRFQQVSQQHSLENTLDVRTLIDLCRPALSEGRRVSATLPIRNTDRAVGTRLGSELTKQYGSGGLPDDSISLHFKGSAGQSFGAFIPKGITLSLEGDANDYVGKGLSGGRIVVFPPRESEFAADKNIIIGNVAFYGATKGDAYINGVAGERFCVRNSGANVVVEALGDHGCEYMTGGRVVVLGKTGRNFAAGMSGGIAYVFDQKGEFKSCCNVEMVSLTRLEAIQEIELVKDMIFHHAELSGSLLAAQLLLDWEQSIQKIVRVMPIDLQRALEGNQDKFAVTTA